MRSVLSLVEGSQIGQILQELFIFLDGNDHRRAVTMLVSHILVSGNHFK